MSAIILTTSESSSNCWGFVCNAECKGNPHGLPHRGYDKGHVELLSAKTAAAILLCLWPWFGLPLRFHRTRQASIYQYMCNRSHRTCCTWGKKQFSRAATSPCSSPWKLLLSLKTHSILTITPTPAHAANAWFPQLDATGLSYGCRRSATTSRCCRRKSKIETLNWRESTVNLFRLRLSNIVF